MTLFQIDLNLSFEANSATVVNWPFFLIFAHYEILVLEKYVPNVVEIAFTFQVILNMYYSKIIITYKYNYIIIQDSKVRIQALDHFLIPGNRMKL